jgi:hypothetical protein
MKIENWWPPGGITAFWLNPKLTDLEQILGATLDAVVRHDRAAAKRESREGCVELQHAERVLAEIYKHARNRGKASHSEKPIETWSSGQAGHG